MKRFNSYLLIGLATILLWVQSKPVQAQDLTGCAGNAPTLKSSDGYDLKPQSGVTIAIDISAGSDKTVKNFVVIGQDPEEEGLSLNVTVTAVEGIMEYDEMVPEQVCVNEKGTEKAPYFCEHQDDYGDQYHYETREKCRSGITSSAHRTIANVKVWLQPSTETAEWLGWAQASKSKKAALRYIFPDKWMAGTWTKDGFVVTGTPDKEWNETYYKNWLAQLEGYNFLAGDTATIFNLWSVTLVEVTDPNNNQSLGVFGNFIPGTYLNPYPSGYTGGPLNISYDDMNSLTEHKRAASNYPSTEPLPDPEFLAYLHLEMSHIPMDLPGMWMVGVLVELKKATFTYKYHNIPGTEVPDQNFWGADDTRWFTMAESGYVTTGESNVFYEYILLSSPCNPMEADNCFDNSY